MKQLFADRGQGQRVWCFAIIVVALFALMAGAAPFDRGFASGQDERGTRTRSLKQKRLRSTGKSENASSQSSTALNALNGPDLPRRILATADFDLIGLAVTASPSTQTVPKNTPTGVLTGAQVPIGGDPDEIIAGLNPNYRVRGELNGPSLNSPLVVESLIGQPLSIPPLSRAGDHALQNLRVVDTGAEGEPVIAPVTPDSVGIVVIDQILISEVRVEELSYDEIIQAGINITDDSYKFFNFVLAVTTSSEPVTFNIPVAFPDVVSEEPPIVGRPNAPFNIGTSVPPFDVRPVMLEIKEQDGGNPPLEIEGQPFTIPGVVVFPGRIGLLNQFFEAIVIVSNGAPGGTPLVVRNLRAKVNLPDNGTPSDPSDDPLRVAATQLGGVVTELEIHGLGPDGVYGTADDQTSFSPGQSGQASFLLEGLKEGLHSPVFDLEGTLEGLPIGPVTVQGKVPGSVLVRDASFAVSFSHPSIVRAGNQYDLAMTVYNSGSRDILGAIVQLNPNSISGATLIGDDSGERALATTIRQKESSTVVWRLRAQVTGQVSASYVKVGEGVEAGLILTTGVGDRNVPLSPASLILPDEVRFLPPDIVEAGRALLGQAWSVATAPRAALPQGVAPISPNTVVFKAQEMGIAGLRVEFGEPVEVALETLMRDWLGELQSPPDTGFFDAMRDTVSGFEWYDAVGRYLNSHLASGGTPASLHKGFANAESPRSLFVSALITQPSGSPIFGARFITPSGQRVGFLNSLTERVGELQDGASLRLDSEDGSATLGQMLLASRPTDGSWSLELTGWQTGVVDISLLVPSTGHSYRHITFSGAQITQGARYRVTFRPGVSTTPALEVFQNGAFINTGAAPIITTINEPAPRLVGAIQVSPDVVAGGDKYGRIVGLLFSKPMQQSSTETATRYLIGGGEIVGSNPPNLVGQAIKVLGAKLGLGERFVFLKLDAGIGPYIRRALTMNNLADERGVSLNPSPAVVDIAPKVSPEGQPPGAYVTGRVLLADGTPVPGAVVTYLVLPCRLGEQTAPIAHAQADSEGRYVFDYVINTDCGPVTMLAVNPANGSKKQLGTPVIYDGQRLVIDHVFIARGNVQGTITIDGAPAPNASVRVVPLLDASLAPVVRADSLGRYLVEDIPVGQVSVLAVGVGSQSAATGLSAGTIEGPGQTATVNVALQSLAGKIQGRVVHPDAASTPSVGSLVVARAQIAGFSTHEPSGFPVGFAYTDRDGNFTISNLPLTDVTLQLRDYVTGLSVTRPVQLSQTTPEVTGIIMTLPGLGAVSGRVVDETGSFVPLAIVQGGSSAVQADALGFYTLTGLHAGTHTITAVETFTGSTGSAQATVLMNETTGNVNITVTRPGTITGQVFFQSGTVPPALVDQAFVTYDGVHITRTDSQGRYTLRNVPPNRAHTMRFVHPNTRLAVNFEAFVAANETIVRNATFRPSAVRGTIYQPDGVTRAVAQLTVKVPLPLLIEGALFGLIESKEVTTQSAADGAYAVTNFNPGTYRVTASSGFFPTKVSKGGTLISGEEQICDIALVETLAGKIQGRVFQPDGVTPVGAGVKVTLGGGLLADVTVMTDAAGH